jgi:hypothetical protein
VQTRVVRREGVVLRQNVESDDGLQPGAVQVAQEWSVLPTEMAIEGADVGAERVPADRAGRDST